MSNLQLKRAERNNFIRSENECKSFDENYKIHWRGVVLSKKKNIVLKNGRTTSGYYTVSLNRKSFYIHRLVAEKFIPNPENKPCINHIDGDKSNNHISNLEWVTYSENMQHASKNGLQVAPKGGVLPHSKSVINTQTKEIFPCIVEAAKSINKSVNHTSAMLNGRRKNTSNLKFL